MKRSLTLGAILAVAVSQGCRDTSRQERPAEGPPIVKENTNDASRQTAIDANGVSALHLAAQRGDLSEIQRRLSAGANPAAVDRTGTSPLLALMTSGFQIPDERRRQCVAVLLAAGAKAARVNEAGHQAVSYAVADAILLKMLVEAGGDAKARFKGILRRETTLLHTAAARGGPDELAYLHSLGLDTERVDSHGWTPLHHAAFAGNRGAVDWLLAQGARKEAKTTRVYQNTLTGIIQPQYPAGSTALDLANISQKNPALRIGDAVWKAIGGRLAVQ